MKLPLTSPSYGGTHIFPGKALNWAWKFALKTFVLDQHSLHGPWHWWRVAQLGLFLSERNGADKRIVYLFGILHDIKRQNDNFDPLHGAKCTAYLSDNVDFLVFGLDDDHMKILFDAIRHHSLGQVSSDVTIATCWDADRLDLIRFGNTIDHGLLSHPLSKSEQAATYAQFLLNLSIMPFAPRIL